MVWRMLNLLSFQPSEPRDLRDLLPVLPPSSSPKCKTTTHQRSFFIRTTRVWKILAEELKLETCGLSTFKSIFYKYYMTSLRTSYDVDDPRSYKTICLKCNCVRSLTNPISCCMYILCFRLLHVSERVSSLSSSSILCLNRFSRYYMSLKVQWFSVEVVCYDLPLRTRKQLVPMLSLCLLLLSFKGAAVIGLRCCGFPGMC
jgi:hypothetical protein